MSECPKCGNDSYVFRDPGVIEYVGLFGRGVGSEECTQVLHSNKLPVFCKCLGCGARFRLSIVREIEEE